MRFWARRCEQLGRRIAASPRAVLVALLAVTAAATPGVIDGAGSLRAFSASDSRAESLPDTALVELACDDGAWSAECLTSLSALTTALAERRDLVSRVDSLSVRTRVVQEGGANTEDPNPNL